MQAERFLNMYCNPTNGNI